MVPVSKEKKIEEALKLDGIGIKMGGEKRENREGDRSKMAILISYTTY